MKKSIIILMLAATGLFSCGQGSKSKVKSQQPKKEYVHTKYEYTDATGASLIIQNSFPKSGGHYTDPDSGEYVYAVFWTRITNETANPLELTIDFPVDSFEIPASSGNYMKLLLPSDTVTAEKLPLYDYGLAIKPFLDNGIHTSSSLKRTVYPKESSAFYVVTLSNRGVGGALRTGLSLKGQQLFYSVNDKKDIPSGKINLENLTLQQ